ncbi:hypothetical protein SVIOM74S_04521 [Streptomyces violarus]
MITAQLTVVLGGGVLPHVTMRMYTASSARQVRRSMSWAVSGVALFVLVITVVGFGATALVGRAVIAQVDLGLRRLHRTRTPPHLPQRGQRLAPAAPRPPGPPRRLVGLRDQPRDGLPQPLQFRVHLPGEHRQPRGPLPGRVTVLGQGLGVLVDLLGTVTAPPHGLEAVRGHRCAAHAGAPLHHADARSSAKWDDSAHIFVDQAEAFLTRHSAQRSRARPGRTAVSPTWCPRAP